MLQFLGRLALAFGLGFSLSGGHLAAPASMPDPLVAGMLAQVQLQALSAYTGGLSGEWPVWVDGGQYLLTTRSTTSGLPIQKATQFVHDHLLTWGLSPVIDEWASWRYSGRNVIGTLSGETLPQEIVLLTAHLDDSPWSGRAPGADDNASGSAAVLLAAEILSQYRFERTVRFAFFTGEEQGLLGSQEYALDARILNEDIVAVVNLDMIGWDALNGPVVRLHARNFNPDLAVAQAFSDVVDTYDLGLTPVITPDGMGASDHASFWARDYPGILAIEDNDDDFNDYYHSTSDRLRALNMGYLVGFVKAAVGTVAGLAGPLGQRSASYSARIEPTAVMQWGTPGDEVTYTVSLTNLGTLPDTYVLEPVNHSWLMSFPAQVGPLAAGDTLELTVTVTIPNDAPGGSADIVRLTIDSVGKSAVVDDVELTTAVHRVHYLPMLER